MGSLDPAVTIRAATPDDADALSLVGAATFLETFAGVLQGADIVEHCRKRHAPDVYRHWLANAAARVWVAEATVGGAPIGYLVLDIADLPLSDLTSSDYEVKRIYLLRRFQGANVGARLMRLALDEARQLNATRLLLGVYSRNQQAIGFYERMGFARVGRRLFHVGLGEYEDHILGRTLDPPTQ